MDLSKARFNMIEQQIRPWEVLDTGVLALLAEVPREDFVPSALRALAYVDMELPIGQKGERMLAPRVQARMVQDLAVRKSDKVLEIGTGTGYTTALLARQAASVLSYEIDPELARDAASRLQQAGLDNARVRQGDGSQGCAAEGPFDVILLSGSVAEVPQLLLEQLATNGRLMAIAGDEPMMRATLVTRTGPASFSTTQPWDTNAPRLSGFAPTPAFRF